MKIWWCLPFIVLTPLSIQGKDTLSLPLLGIDIDVISEGFAHEGVVLYNMHDNENTSAIAGRVVSREYGGEYFELIHTGKRFFSFAYGKDGKDSVHVDPNRIYTDAGIWQQLLKNKVKDTLLFDSIKIWRDAMLRILDIQSRELVIALHNNTDQKYSVKSYLPGGEYENEAEAVFRGRIREIDDFYFVTDPFIFESLATGRYNVILQNNATMTDDGSLSVYCAQYGIPYVNVETQHFHMVRQIKMLIYAMQQLVRKE